MAVALSAAPAIGLNATPVGPAALDCAIRTVSQDGIVRFEATATAQVAAAGSYRMLIAKSGENGVTRNAQSGAFRIVANETRVLSVSTLFVRPDDRYEAELTIKWHDQVRTCHATKIETAERQKREKL
jgi:hypothetical protein